MRFMAARERSPCHALALNAMIRTRLLRLVRRLFVFGVPLLAFLYFTSRTTPPVLAPGVTKEVKVLPLAGRTVSVTFYYPNQNEAPLVVVAHGFTRAKRYMAGWGALLARDGFIAAVLTQPGFADHELNANAIAELVAQVRSGSLKLKVKPTSRIGLMGHSMGGLTTLLAAGKQPVDAWVGLDPVGMNDSWLSVGKTLHTPCAVLRAEPGAWNMQGNARPLFAVLPGPKFTMKVRGSTHLDPESPTDVLGQLACGFADQKRREVFERYAIAFLKAQLLNDTSAKQVLRDAAKDSALTEVDVSLP